MSNASTAGSILLVEDEDTQAKPFAELLSFRGYSVHVAYNGTDALALARKQRPEVAVVDLLLIARGDALDGYEVIRALRESPESARVGIMAWSAHYIRPQDEIRALRAGADSFVSKDAEYGVLEARIDALLRRARM